MENNDKTNIGMRAAQIAKEKLLAGIRKLKEGPDFLRLFREIEEATKRHDSVKLKRTIRENYRLRFEVFKRDGFRCQYCGRSPKSDPDVILQLDHVIPRSKGGETIKENLTTACQECNVGKGAGSL